MQCNALCIILASKTLKKACWYRGEIREQKQIKAHSSQVTVVPRSYATPSYAIFAATLF